MVPIYIVFLALFSVTYEFNKVSGRTKEKSIICFYFCINDRKVKTLPDKKNEFLIQKTNKKNKKGAVLKNISKKRVLVLF